MSTPDASIIQQLQEDIAGRLNGYSEAFQYVPVLVMNDRSNAESVQIKSALDKSLMGKVAKGGKSGLAVMVLVPDLGGRDPDVPGPQLVADCTVSVIENPLINRGANGTNILPDELALIIQRLLDHWAPDNYPFTTPERNGLIKARWDDKIAWEVTMTINVANTPITCASMPRITVVDDLVTMTAADGVAIYYTTDGSLPTAATGTLYTVPFALTTPGSVWVRAVGSVSGLADSSPRGLRITVTE